MKNIFNTLLGIGVLALLFLTSCGSAPQRGSNAGTVLASATFLADIAQNVAGNRVRVDSLLPIGADPHAYQPAPRDAAAIAQSELLIVNGAEYEHFIESLLENAGGEGKVIEAAAGIGPREEAEGGHGMDPHFWLDPNYVVVYVENIRDGLAQFDPGGAAVYQSNAEAYIAELKELDSWIRGEVAQIPPERRLLITNHESLGYFADRYGFTLVGAIVPGTSSGASPSAGQMAALIEQIKASGAPAIFLDAGDNETLARQIASETGVRVVTDLHIESLTEGAPAATYIDMMKHNVSAIVEALR
jgi:ABC-type Zn uptake system ZnuABC Zn-binding protein ZnuA